MIPRDPQHGEPLSVSWARSLVAEVRRNRVTAGVGLRLAVETPNGRVLSVDLGRTPKEPTDAELTNRHPLPQRSIERDTRGLQLRRFHEVGGKSDTGGVIGDWIEADPETGYISAKKKASKYIELVVRLTDGKRKAETQKDVRYLWLGKTPGDTGEYDDDDETPFDPLPPPCGHPGNDPAPGEGGPGSPYDPHPGDDPDEGDHPGDIVSPPCGGPAPT